MKKIKLNDNKYLSLPEKWEDLSNRQRKFAFELLIQLLDGKITPFQFNYQMFIDITGYRPHKKNIKDTISKLFLCFFCSSKKYLDAKENQRLFEDTIEFNLIKLVESLDFAFYLDGMNIVPNYDFMDNPFLNISPYAPHFLRNYTVDTDITAKQFADCVDLLNALSSDSDPDFRSHVFIKIAEILYRISYAQAAYLSKEVLFGIAFWFTGIFKFFREHPIYSILFSNKKQEGEKISLGQSEVLLFLQKQGYSNTLDMNLTDFFNAQIKSLKDSIAEAISNGVKLDVLASSIGIDMVTLQKLS